MVLLTIYVQSFEDVTRLETFEIDNGETFASFRTKVSKVMNVPFNDLLLAAGEEYNGSFNSKKISEISSISNGMTLFAVYQVGGGK